VAFSGATPVAARLAAAPKKASAAILEATKLPAPAGTGVLALRSYAFTNNPGCDRVQP
jgi:hypothetical protein